MTGLCGLRPAVHRRRASVTVTAVNRFAADELISASREAEMLVVGVWRRAPPQRVTS